MRRVQSWLLLAAGALVVAAGVIGPGSSVSAHTELEATMPADGEVVSVPVEAVTLVFTADVTVIHDGFEVLDPTGAVRAPTALEGGGRTHVLRFEPPLAAGTVGVRWAVAAADGHVIEGTFSFVVDAPVPTTTPATSTPITTTTQVPASTAPTTTPSSSSTPRSTSETTVPSTTTAPTTAPSTTAAPTTTVSDDQLDEFLAGGGPTDDGSRRVGDVGRAVGFAGVVLGVGAVAFALLVLRHRPVDADVAASTAVAGGSLAVLGSIVEGIGHAGAISGDGLSVIGNPGMVVDALSSTFGTAIILRIVGGLVLVAACARWTRRAAAAGRSPFAMVGTAALALSFSFDGHTVGEGPRILHSIVDVVHVTAASVWAGGVVVLTAFAWRSRREEARASVRGAAATVSAAASPLPHRPMLELGVRFSIVATWALLAVTAAGIVMALLILDRPGDLTGTSWGRTLLVKLAVVTVAVGCGWYNRVRALPALVGAPDDHLLHARLRGVLTFEAVTLVVVVMVASVLVGAAA